MTNLWKLILMIGFSCLFVDGIKDVATIVNLEEEGVIAGYGDFNSDKATDLFMVSRQWRDLYVYLWDVIKQTFMTPQLLLEVSNEYEILNIALADFNGDGNMDVLLSSKSRTHPKVVTVEVYYGDTKALTKGNFTAHMADQPTILDVNGDLLPDLFGVNSVTNVRSYWISILDSQSNQHSFLTEVQKVTDTQSTVVVPNSNAFIDVTGDRHADLFIKSKNKKGEVLFETWQQNTGMSNLTLNNKKIIMMNNTQHSIHHIGQMSFADIDGDSQMDLLLPLCLSGDCTQSVVFKKALHDDSAWVKLASNDGENWQFPVADMKNPSRFPVTLRFNDVTLDGMMDAVGILQEKRKDGKGKLFPAYFINTLCSNKKQCNGNRTLSMRRIDIVSSDTITSEKPVLISVMDINQNGVLDFMVTYENTNDVTNKKYNTKVLVYNDMAIDSAFLKVAVLSGLNHAPMYGSNQIGAVVEISTTDTKGSAMLGESVQLSQSTYFSLQLPYVIFGLGRVPNFVEKIQVGLPKGPQKINRVKTWNTIIPNAQVIVIPYPKDIPEDWGMKLLVTPGKLLLQTGGILIGTILFIGGIILILHIKEKREDEREKRRDAHKFHFDAL